MADPRIKQIKIQTGVVKRLAKEKLMYMKEAEKEKQKLEKMKEDGAEDYVIRKQGEVIQETLMMIPDCQKRYQTAYSQLKEILDSETDLAENEDFQTALTVLKETSEAVSCN